MNVHFIIIALAVIGFAESVYLMIQSRKNRPPVCVIGGGCVTVWESSYSKTFGIGNDVLGLMFYAFVLAVETVIVNGASSVTVATIESMTLFVGAIMSLYFVYLQAQVIRAWCFWCTLSAVVTWLMLAALLLL